MSKLLKVLPAMIAMLMVSMPAFAEGNAAAAGSDWQGMAALGAGLGIGLAALGGGLGQGRTAAAALEGIARNPQAAGKLNTPMIIGLALIESLVIYALVISFMIQGKF